MKKQEIVWTALPNGFDTSDESRRQLKLSVFVSPRLQTDEVPQPMLSHFADFAENWSQKMASLSFEIVFQNGDSINARTNRSQLDPELWEQLFPKETFVRPFAFRDMSDRAIRTYPIKEVMAYLQKIYTQLGEKSPASLPPLEVNRDDDGNPKGKTEATLQQFIDEIGQMLTPEKEILCTYGGKDYDHLKNILSEPNKEKILLNYVVQCLDRKGISLLGRPRIYMQNDLLWIVRDENNEYFVEDTGSAIVVCRYFDIYQDLEDTLAIEKVLDPLKNYGISQEHLSFLQVNRFFDRKEDKEEFFLQPNARHVRPAPEDDKIDFHQMLALLGDHPFLMRKLGIVLDLVFPVPDFTISSIQVVPVWRSENKPVDYNVDHSPVTSCLVTEQMFIAAPGSSKNLVDGMLNLEGVNDNLKSEDLPYHLLQIDPEGSALKALRAGASMVGQIKRRYLGTFSRKETNRLLRDRCHPELGLLKELFYKILNPPHYLSDVAKITTINATQWLVNDQDQQFELEMTTSRTIHVYRKQTAAFDTPDDAGLPALQTAGIGVFKSGRAYELYHRLRENKKKNAQLNSSSAIKFYADDLLRGYRVDVLDKYQPVWRSLCQRVGKYYVGEDAKNPSPQSHWIPVEDEGYVKSSSTTSSDAGKSDLYLNETMFRWDGWSLVAQRPGKTIKPVPGEERRDLFIWDDVGSNAEKIIAFLHKTFHARWVGKEHITANGSIITVSDGRREYVFRLDSTKVVVTAHNERNYEYGVRQENGKSIVYTTIPTQSERVEPLTARTETDFKMASVFTAKPGSLPRLRFGHAYKLRARMVDLAGNSIPVNDAPDQHATDWIYFTRYEPVAPPTLVPRAPFTEGEALERLVIRSNFDQSASQYAQNKYVQSALNNEIYSYETGCERHIVPPKTSQTMAERHGEFDAFFGEGQNYVEGYRIAIKEEGTLTDKSIVNIQTGKKESLPDPDAVKVFSGLGADAPGQYIVHREEQLLLPYLPDPIARGVTFSNLPGNISGDTLDLEKIIDPSLDLDLLKVPFNTQWPDSLPFRIRIEERPGDMLGGQCDETFTGKAPPVWNPEERVLTVFLGKAEVKTIRYSCFIDEDDLALMGIWKWIRGGRYRDNLRKYGLAGCHWMMTPFREITLVHAVQQPLCEPRVLEISTSKHRMGDTMAEVMGELYLSAKSTDKVSLLAYWTEPVDDVNELAPHTKDVHAKAFELTVTDNFDDKVSLPVTSCITHNHEFGDTKYRKVWYYMRGSSKFREYFHPTIAGTREKTSSVKFSFNWSAIPGEDTGNLLNFLKQIRQISEPSQVQLEREPAEMTIIVREQDTSIILRQNTDRNGICLETSGGERYIFEASFDESGNTCVAVDGLTRQGPFVETEILNSARPLAPVIKYIVPTFGWEQDIWTGGEEGAQHLIHHGVERRPPFTIIEEGAEWQKIRRVRRGGSVRVYLDRPWYSSGDGELLGVMLLPQLVPDSLKSYVTQWGMDPARNTKVPKGGLDITDFDNVVQGQRNLSIGERDDTKFNVAGFKVEYNNERQLWFCDIQLEPAIMVSYFPFIRFALARYQPNSIENAHLSPVVLTDFIQVANDRTLNVEKSQSGDKLFVRLEGVAFGGPEANRVEVRLEALIDEENKDFGWEPLITRRPPNPVVLDMVSVDTAACLWKWEGEIKVPLEVRGQRCRLVVSEYERFLADNEAPSMEILGIANKTPRMVYCDIVEF